jgi:prepilin-type N-terminal cleavage/methylation domain-containing protein
VRPLARATSRIAGFTLVEMLVVLALIGILIGLAVSYSGESRANLRAFGDQIVGEADTTRLRATSTRRWHKIEFDTIDQRMEVYEADVAGMVQPTDDSEWMLVNQVEIPGSSEVYAIATTSNVVDGDGVPGEGDNLDLALMFSPDGSAEPRTVYLRSADQRKSNRIVVYRATGTAMRKDSW